MRDFRTLEVWKLAHELTLQMYSITSNFPKEEMYNITSQLRRASSSVGANIAEGAGRRTQVDFRQFIHTAVGSLKECHNFVLLSKDLGYLTEGNFCELIERMEHLGRMLTNFLKMLNQATTVAGSV